MADLVHKFQKVTLTGTSEHQYNFDTVLRDRPDKQGSVNGIAAIELLSGASVQVSSDAAIDGDSGTVTTAAPKVLVDIRTGYPLRLTGGAGSEVLNISILSE